MSLGGKRVDASGVRKEMYKVCEGLRKKASRRLEPLLNFFFSQWERILARRPGFSSYIPPKYTYQALLEPTCLFLVLLTLRI